MTVRLNEKFATPFVAPHELDNLRPAVSGALEALQKKNGPGSDFLGWMDLPVNYDKEEFARILDAATRIKKSCDILVVIGAFSISSRSTTL